jgi:hypothetical protein
MGNWNNNDIKKQFVRAQSKGWIAAFKKAGTDYDFPPELLMGIASRETNMNNIIGDSGHGYGIMQIDDRSFPDWCHSGAWKDAIAGIGKGALVLDGKREQIRSGQGKKLSVGGNSFVGKPNLTASELLRAAVAAYNSGLWAYYELTKNGNPDGHTTGKDYSADTYARTAIFKGLM